MRADGVGVFLPLRRGLTPNLSRRVHGVLRLDGAYDFRDSDGQLGQLVGPDPEPHGVLARAENLDIADTGHACELVVEVDVSVVGQEPRVVGAVWRVQADQHERSSHRFPERDPVVRNLGRELRGSLSLADLSEDQIVVRVRLHVEVHHQGHPPVGRGVQGIHVVHVVHAAHLLFDGSGNRLLDRLCVRADIGGQHLNFRGCNAGELSHWQADNGDRAHDHQQDGDHHRNDGPVDEKFRHTRYLPFISAAKGLGFTCMPGRTFCTPSATTRSPGFSPSSMIHMAPTRSPGLTVRMSILFSASTTAT